LARFSQNRLLLYPNGFFMKKSVSYFLFTALLLAFALYLTDSKSGEQSTSDASYSEEKQQEVFTDDEIKKLSDYNSDYFRMVGTSENKEQADRFFSFFDIPDSVKVSYEFKFYLLEFRHLTELHAHGKNKETNNSFIIARTLNEMLPDS